MIKAERQQAQSDGWVKPEPGHAEEALRSVPDEDIYEDAGDLDFTSGSRPLLLTRVPKFLWDSWNSMGEDEELQIGTLRIEGSTQMPTRMSLLLAISTANNLPKEYNMQIVKSAPSDALVFTEKDLPGYNSRLQEADNHDGIGSVNGAARLSPRPGFQDRAKNQRHYSGRGRKWHPYQRRTIPKQTAIVGYIDKDINCLPVENAEYHRFMAEKNQAERGTTTVSDFQDTLGSLMAPGTNAALRRFTNFTKISGAVRGKTQEPKAARMPQNELLDLIYDCFKRYRYWTMRSIKDELNQPETYLRSTLELVAVLVKQGPHSGTWQLRPDAQLSAYEGMQMPESVKDEAAPDVEGGGDSDTKDLEDFDDDENAEMVDAL